MSPKLHLARALDDRELLRVAVVELHRVVLHVPGRAEHLERVVAHLHRELRRVVLAHREVRDELLGELTPVGHPRGPVGEQPRRFDLGGELGDLPLDALEVGDRLGERLALLRVLHGVHERTLGEPDPPRRDDGPHRVEAEHAEPEPADVSDDVLGRDAHLVEDAARRCRRPSRPSSCRGVRPTRRPKPVRRRTP